MSMTLPTIVIGAILTAIGLFGYFNATPNDQGNVSPTALIPAAFGVAIFLIGLIVLVMPGTRKHAMHGAAMIGLFGFLGGFAPILRGFNKTGSVDFTKPSVLSGLGMSVVCLIFVALCVKSFIDVRRARAAQNAAPANG